MVQELNPGHGQTSVSAQNDQVVKEQAAQRNSADKPLKSNGGTISLSMGRG